MAGDVGEFCRTCLTCNRSKPSNKGLPRRDKWVHLDHCKLFEGTTTTVHPPSATTEETEPGAVPNAQPEQLGPMVSQEDTPNGLETSSSSAAAEYEQPNSLEDIEETEFVPERRYPRRETRPPQYLADYTEWDGMPRQYYSRRPHLNQK